MSKRPTAKQRDERLKVDLTPNQLVEGLLNAGPHPEKVTPPRKSPKDKAPARKKK